MAAEASHSSTYHLSQHPGAPIGLPGDGSYLARGCREPAFPGPLVLIIALAICMRACLLFSTPYMPGLNGAYYLVQARALLERGALGIPDLPLIFHLHAALAWLLAKTSGLGQAEAILWAVKGCDAVLPPLVAWPVFVLVRHWAKSRGQNSAVPLAAAALSCFSWPWYRMLGDFQKNSLALVWLVALAMTLHAWLNAPSLKRGFAVLACLLLLSLTHVGVLGAALVMLATVLLVFLARQGLAGWRQLLPWLAAGLLLLTFAGTWVLLKYDAARIHRLITALTAPATFSSDGLQAPPMPAGRMRPAPWLPSIGFALAVLPGLVLAWRRRRSLPVADIALVSGMAITVLAMTGPWFNEDKSVRFTLIALVPALLVGAFAVLQLSSTWVRRSVIGVALLLGIGSTLPAFRHGESAILSEAALLELQSLSKHISNPDRTLICARHGVEWWTAWFLHTRITQSSALKPEDWQNYDSVYFLETKSDPHMPYGPGGGPPPPGMGPPPGFGPPGAGTQGFGSPSFMPPPGMMPPRMGPGPMMSAPIPSDAELVHDGQHLKLARITAPPESLIRQQPDEDE